MCACVVVCLWQINAAFANHNGTTALHLASSGGHLAAVQLLIDRPDVDVNARDSRGDTPLFKAILWRDLGAVELICRQEMQHANQTVMYVELLPFKGLLLGISCSE